MGFPQRTRLYVPRFQPAHPVHGPSLGDLVPTVCNLLPVPSRPRRPHRRSPDRADLWRSVGTSLRFPGLQGWAAVPCAGHPAGRSSVHRPHRVSRLRRLGRRLVGRNALPCAGLRLLPRGDELPLHADRSRGIPLHAGPRAGPRTVRPPRPRPADRPRLSQSARPGGVVLPLRPEPQGRDVQLDRTAARWLPCRCATTCSKARCRPTPSSSSPIRPWPSGIPRRSGWCPTSG